MGLTDWLFFTKTIDVSTSSTPETVWRSLSQLHAPRQGSERSSCQVELFELGNNRFEFKVQMLRRNRWWDYTSAEATGIIEPDNATGKTLVRGKVGFAGFYYIMSVLFPIIVLLIVATHAFDIEPGSEVTMLLAGAGITLYLWITLFMDREQLIGQLEDKLPQMREVKS